MVAYKTEMIPTTLCSEIIVSLSTWRSCAARPLLPARSGAQNGTDPCPSGIQSPKQKVQVFDGHGADLDGLPLALKRTYANAAKIALMA